MLRNIQLKSKLQNFLLICFLWAALGAMAASLTLKILKKDETALFVGQWPAPFMLLGIYNKLVKQEGHEGEK